MHIEQHDPAAVNAGHDGELDEELDYQQMQGYADGDEEDLEGEYGDEDGLAIDNDYGQDDDGGVMMYPQQQQQQDLSRGNANM